MAKIKHVEHIYNGEKYHHDQYHYWCEGCGGEHAFALRHEGGNHDFNGDLNSPTVNPSLLENYPPKVCHSFIRDGKIQYLGDCWHALAGQTIELPDIDQKLQERKNKQQ